MTDLVVGGGAVGTLIAWALASGGREVAVVRRALGVGQRPAEVAAIDPDGARRSAAVTEVGRPEDLANVPDLIVFAVKMFDLTSADHDAPEHGPGQERRQANRGRKEPDVCTR